MIDQVSIPEGSCGRWTVKKFTVSKRDAAMARIRAMQHGRGVIDEGATYTQLMRGGCLVMSDTPDEMRDHYEPVSRAKGHILINGLGLGMVLAACLRRKGVERATVVEVDPDVVALVGPHYADPRVEIVTASAFDYQPPKDTRYGMVWHDIWDNICGNNLAEMTKLKRKYGRRADWQGCWCEWRRRRGR